MDHEVERMLLAERIATGNRLKIDSLQLWKSHTLHVLTVVAL
ncbi:MAG: hypothetical protein JWN85_1080 [Gammaproteobacteria bacterium]|nr:hypothetical protein [Gammaproteobacteria bacterium]